MTEADLEGSETDVAVSRTASGEVIFGGALYMFCTPLAVIAALNDFDDVWGAVRHFFSAEAKALEGPA